MYDKGRDFIRVWPKNVIILDTLAVNHHMCKKSNIFMRNNQTT